MQVTKKCTKCGHEKKLDSQNFFRDKNRNNGLSPVCKECDKIRTKKWRRDNKEYNRLYMREYYQENKEKLIKYQSDFREENKDSLKIKRAIYSRRYYKKNRKKLIKKSIEDHKERLSRDPAYALTCRTRRSIRKCLTIGRSFSHLPYTKDELVARLKSTLPEGYTESDICDGSKLHIDHIRPVSSFNLSGEVDDEFLKCWSLDNLQLLPATENKNKSNRLDWDKQ